MTSGSHPCSDSSTGIGPRAFITAWQQLPLVPFALENAISHFDEGFRLFHRVQVAFDSSKAEVNELRINLKSEEYNVFAMEQTIDSLRCKLAITETGKTSDEMEITPIPPRPSPAGF